MDDWQPVTSGESGARVFRSADGTTFRKAVDITDWESLADERDRIVWAAAHGVPGPVVLDWNRNDVEAELILGAVPGVPADRLSEAAVAAAWPSIVDAVRSLHEIPVDDCPYRRDLETMLALARAVVGRDAVHRDFLADEDRAVPAAALLQRVTRDAAVRRTQELDDLVVCHGDLCLPNILVSDASVSGFVDLGRLGVADRHADLALLLDNTRQTFPRFPARTELARRYPWPVDEQRLQFYLRLDPLTW
ncbi:APH(3'') family aminoglycoside O-phosphotransferase [Mycolicibacterium sp. S2-37]|uniref:APH(3'') family aminoglycoside O-phosphotransferase n=1 Tax=Mycolicibacterium sp. S2-37 TaxID=2810297 RepID=UPI001A9423A7|nr:APH(3'') family aminoglycoside O-phosphotransferase [Mycolicibacterium sp. S2-37]MBO0679254.1 APH(3'') family aminoglycoside O-phosphotransferase [Mycolicibacterium sp. S2-37]